MRLLPAFLKSANRSNASMHTRASVHSREPALVTHDHTLQRLRSLVGTPAGHWRLLYQATLDTYVVRVQALVAENEVGDQRQLLERSIKLALCALTLRQGKLLPTDAKSDGPQQDLWTYAVFSAALLYPVTSLRSDRAVLAEDESGYPDVPRTVESLYPNESVLRQLAARVCPPTALSWLTEDQDVFQSWLLAIAGRFDEAGSIGFLIADAIRGAEIGSAVFSAHKPVSTAPSSDTARPARLHGETNATTKPHPKRTHDQTNEDNNPAQAFMNWLRDGLRNKSLPVNTREAHVHITREGLLLVSPAIFRDFDQDKWKWVQKRFARMRLHVRNADGACFHRYAIEGSRRTNILRGYLLADSSDALADLTLPDVNPRLQRQLRGRAAVRS
jgi:hypothetical protein